MCDPDLSLEELPSAASGQGLVHAEYALLRAIAERLWYQGAIA
nr:hypothetical protein [uncultured Pseudogulbenkiania sp.]